MVNITIANLPGFRRTNFSYSSCDNVALDAFITERIDNIHTPAANVLNDENCNWSLMLKPVRPQFNEPIAVPYIAARPFTASAN